MRRLGEDVDVVEFATNSEFHLKPLQIARVVPEYDGGIERYFRVAPMREALGNNKKLARIEFEGSSWALDCLAYAHANSRNVVLERIEFDGVSIKLGMKYLLHKDKPAWKSEVRIHLLAQDERLKNQDIAALRLQFWIDGEPFLLRVALCDLVTRQYEAVLYDRHDHVPAMEEIAGLRQAVFDSSDQRSYNLQENDGNFTVDFPLGKLMQGSLWLLERTPQDELAGLTAYPEKWYEYLEYTEGGEEFRQYIEDGLPAQTDWRLISAVADNETLQLYFRHWVTAEKGVAKMKLLDVLFSDQFDIYSFELSVQTAEETRIYLLEQNADYAPQYGFHVYMETLKVSEKEPEEIFDDAWRPQWLGHGVTNAMKRICQRGLVRVLTGMVLVLAIPAGATVALGRCACSGLGQAKKCLPVISKEDIE